MVARIDESGRRSRPKPSPLQRRRKPRPSSAAAAPPAQQAPKRSAAPSRRLRSQATAQPTPAPEQVEDAAPTGPLSPLVRKMARENNIDLSKVKGTGAGGRITKQDVEALHRAGGGSARQLLRPRQARGSAPRRQPPRQPPAPLPPAGQAKTRIEPHEHHAHQDRRAHGDVEAHLGARHHRASRRHDQGGQDARAQQGTRSRRTTASR